MATNTLELRISQKCDTTANWAASTLVLLKGELAIDTELLTVKIGDGINTYPNLPYATITPEQVNDLISETGHVHSNKEILDAITASFTEEMRIKLAGIEDGATNTVVDETLSDSSTNPVQNQAVTNELNNKVPVSRTINGYALNEDITLDADDVGAIDASEKGSAGGVAELDESGKVLSSQLPSYVDDVIEGYLSGSTFYEESSHTTSISPESGIIYVDLETNKTYRWSGSTYVEISESLALGETASTAYRGDLGAIAYEHSQSAHAPSDAEKNIIVAIQENGTELPVDETTRTVNVIVPTAVSELTNDSNYATTSEVESAVSDAIATVQDVNVTQTPTSTNANYRVLFSGSANDTEETEGVGKDSALTYNPSTDTLTVPTVVGDLQGNASTATLAETAEECSGNASTASALESSRTIATSGGATGTATAFDGSSDITIPITSVNTDYLINGSDTLILNCGDSTT